MKKIASGQLKKGPKGSSILELDISKVKLKKILKAVKLETFTFAELKYQEDGLLYMKRKPTLEDITIGAFILRAVKESVEASK